MLYRLIKFEEILRWLVDVSVLFGSLDMK